MGLPEVTEPSAEPTSSDRILTRASGGPAQKIAQALVSIRHKVGCSPCRTDMPTLSASQTSSNARTEMILLSAAVGGCRISLLSSDTYARWMADSCCCGGALVLPSDLLSAAGEGCF